MQNEIKQLKDKVILMPVAGTLLFIVLYFIATLLYPGGNQVDKNAVGFSWMNNYWCNLLNENAINGQHNSAQPVAMTGMFVLCLTMSIFWVVFPRYTNLSNRWKLIIQASGILAMFIAFFLFTNINHDLITNLACLSGSIAVIGTFAGLYKSKKSKLFTFGMLNIVLVILNNYCYYTKAAIIYLPVVQKITFAAFLSWICSICLTLYYEQKEKVGCHGNWNPQSHKV